MKKPSKKPSKKPTTLSLFTDARTAICRDYPYLTPMLDQLQAYMDELYEADDHRYRRAWHLVFDLHYLCKHLNTSSYIVYTSGWDPENAEITISVTDPNGESGTISTHLDLSGY